MLNSFTIFILLPFFPFVNRRDYNYNNFIGCQRHSPSNRYEFFFGTGNSGARLELQSVADALYGSIPDLFMFGTHSAWTGEGGEMLTFELSLENPDPKTLISLELAKKVSALHKEIGMLEMTGFEFSDNGYIQKTTFEGGIDVYANFSQNVIYLDGVGSLTAESWVVVKK